MSNKEFFNMFKEFIIKQCIEYENEDLWIYYEILKQYKNKGEIQEMIYNCNNILNIRYDTSDRDNYGTDGTIIIDADNGISYEIILCCLYPHAINIKKIDYYDILTFDDNKYNELQQKWLNEIEEMNRLHIQSEINIINNEINELAIIKEKLEGKLEADVENDNNVCPLCDEQLEDTYIINDKAKQGEEPRVYGVVCTNCGYERYNK